MFPLGDDNSMRRTTPFVTYALILVNVLAFLLELQNGDAFIQEWLNIFRCNFQNLFKGYLTQNLST